MVTPFETLNFETLKHFIEFKELKEMKDEVFGVAVGQNGIGVLANEVFYFINSNKEKKVLKKVIKGGKQIALGEDGKFNILGENVVYVYDESENKVANFKSENLVLTPNACLLGNYVVDFDFKRAKIKVFKLHKLIREIDCKSGVVFFDNFANMVYEKMGLPHLTVGDNEVNLVMENSVFFNEKIGLPKNIIRKEFKILFLENGIKVNYQGKDLFFDNVVSVERVFVDKSCLFVHCILNTKNAVIIITNSGEVKIIYLEKVGIEKLLYIWETIYGDYIILTSNSWAYNFVEIIFENNVAKANKNNKVPEIKALKDRVRGKVANGVAFIKERGEVLIF